MSASEPTDQDAALGADATAAVTATDPSDPGVSRHRFHGYLSMQARGVVALPPALRRRYALDRPGAQVEVTEREDGVLEVRPMVAVPAGEAWFWTERWQAGEREVDARVARGEVTTADSTEDFLAHLADLDDQATASGVGEHAGAESGSEAALAAGSADGSGASRE